jgi:pimeloyl-ACP methyl ester carboxylesterase
MAADVKMSAAPSAARTLVTWACAGAAAYAVLCLAGGALFVDRALQRPRRAISPAARQQADALARSVGARLDAVSVLAGDGAALRGWSFMPAAFNGHSVVLLHGIVSNRASMLPAARMFLERGYRVLAVDARAHGDSDGAQITFGALESDDVRRWIALATGGDDACVYLFGGSLGGSYALQASDAPALCAVVAVAGYASLREIAFDRIGERVHTGPWLGRTVVRPGVELGFLYARVRYGFNLSAASAPAAVARAGAPILLIQGTHDEITPARHARLIHVANPSRVSLWLVPGGSHAPAAQAGADYSRRVIEFLETHRRPWSAP